MTRARPPFAAPLLAIMLMALAVRLWYVTTLPGQGRDLIFSDMASYDYTASQLVRGLPMAGEPGLNGYHPLGASTYYYIGYTYFLAAIYAVFGHSLSAVRVTQALVGTLTVGVAALLGRLCFGRRQGLVAAALTAVYLPLVYYAGLLLTETWFSFLQVAALGLWLRAWVRGPGDGGEDRRTGLAGGLGLAVLAGLATGLACLTRPAFLPALATLPAGVWLVPPVAASRRRRAALVASFVAAAASVIAPITVRNYQIHGRFVLISTNGPSTFLTGHVTKSADLPADVPPGTNDMVISDRHRSLVHRYLAEHWREYLAEIPEFFQIIWTESDFWPSTTTYWIQNPPPGRARVDISAHLNGSPPFGRITYFPDLVRYADRALWGLIGLPLAFLAVLFLPRTHRRWVVIYLGLVPYVIIPFIAYAFSRFRLPAAPLVFILAGQTLVSCWDCRARRT